MKTPAFPIEVKRGSAVVKIYSTPDRGCDAFTVSYWHNGKRHREKFSQLQRAKDAAAAKASEMSSGAIDVVTLRSADRAAYLRAIELIKPLGISLEMAIAEFVEAKKAADGGSLVEAAKFSATRNPSKLPAVSVSTAVNEFINDRQVNGVSKHHLALMRSRLGRFADAFCVPIASVDPSTVKEFLANLTFTRNEKKAPKPISARTKNNYRDAISQLFRFARMKKYLPKDHEGLLGVDDFKETPGEIQIYSPAEISLLLNHARGDLIPFIAIAAFAGLRHVEIGRLDWKEVRLSTGYIEVKAAKAKTASRRLVPITANLAKWLSPIAKTSGRVCYLEDMTKPLLRLARKKALRKAKFQFKHNALRHSWISYRVADVKNVAQVALEAGNSPSIIFKNYRELVTEADAKTWFAIDPPESSKVIPMAA